MGRTSDPLWLYVYLYAVIAAWLLLALAFGFFMILLAYVGDQLGGVRGRHLGAATGLGLAFFFVVGVAFGAFASLFAYAARRRYKRLGHVDATCERYMRLARLYNASLLVQASVGLGLGVLAGLA